MTERHQVALFLELLRQCAKCAFQFERRAENMATLAQLGITVRDAKARILALTPEEYVSGPTPRPERPEQESWVFGLRIQGTTVYVKVSVRSEPVRCLCVSFHEPKRPLSFPYAEDTMKEGDQ